MPPPVITLFEHQFRSYTQIGLEPLSSRAAERTLARLERINEIAGQEILHLGRKGLRANALVGILRAGDLTIEILPKIDYPTNLAKDQRSQPGLNHHGSDSPEAVHSAARNLLAMLSYAYDLRFYGHDTAGLATQPGTWLELLTHLFAADLRQELLSGLSQEYISREENLNVLRGRWDIQRQLHHPDHDERSFDVIYDDLSPDIPLNQVFRFVVERLLHLSQDPDNQAMLKDLADKLRLVTMLPQVPLDLVNSIQFNRLNERFQPAFHLARMFLTGSAIQLTAGNQAAHAFVFDMNVLFERFVAGFITRHRQEILPQGWQDLTVLPQSEGAGLYLARWKGKNILRLRPDLLFSRSGQSAPLLIADTKYKPLNTSQRSPGIAPEDIYQMLAYTNRYQCSRGLLLYPQNRSGDPARMQLEMNLPNQSTLLAATLNLRVPLQQPGELISELHGILKFVTTQPGGDL